MTHNLVQHIRFGGVERHRVMAYVLGRVEGAVGQRAVEVRQRHQSGGRYVAEPGQRTEQIVDLGQLGNPRLRKAEPTLALQIEGAGQPFVQPVQLPADDPPHLVLGFGVGRRRRRLGWQPGQGQRRQRVAPRSVFRVDSARMVITQMYRDRAVAGAGHRCVKLAFLEHLELPFVPIYVGIRGRLRWAA